MKPSRWSKDRVMAFPPPPRPGRPYGPRLVLRRDLTPDMFRSSKRACYHGAMRPYEGRTMLVPRRHRYCGRKYVNMADLITNARRTSPEPKAGEQDLTTRGPIWDLIELL